MRLWNSPWPGTGSVSAPAVGSVLMAIFLTFSPLKKGAGRKMLWAVAGFGAATVAFALSTNLYLSMFLLFLTGAFDSVSVIVRQTTPGERVIEITDAVALGTTTALNGLTITGGRPDADDGAGRALQ